MNWERQNGKWIPFVPSQRTANEQSASAPKNSSHFAWSSGGQLRIVALQNGDLLSPRGELYSLTREGTCVDSPGVVVDFTGRDAIRLQRTGTNFWPSSKAAQTVWPELPDRPALSQSPSLDLHIHCRSP